MGYGTEFFCGCGLRPGTDKKRRIPARRRIRRGPAPPKPRIPRPAGNLRGNPRRGRARTAAGAGMAGGQPLHSAKRAHGTGTGALGHAAGPRRGVLGAGAGLCTGGTGRRLRRCALPGARDGLSARCPERGRADGNGAFQHAGDAAPGGISVPCAAV